MPSRAELSRRVLEPALRIAALAALGWSLWRAVAPAATAGLVVVDGGALAAALARWSTGAAPESVHAGLDALPDAATRDWLAALARSGTSVGWSVGDAPALAVSVAPVPGPAGGVRIAVAAPASRLVALRDAVGPLDTVRAGGAGASLEAAAPVGAVVATSGGARASRASHDPGEASEPKRVLVLARAGWEGKFVVAALEERGWRVEARLAVAPGARVEQGTIAPDTARHAAVVVLDTSAAPLAPALARYARSGGGLVLGAEGSRLATLAALAPGRVGARVLPPAARDAGDVSRASLPYRPIALRADGVPLERRGDAVVLAARRASAGRVALVGLEETWLWRMAGDDGSAAAHRAWWSRVVAAVASTGHAPVVGAPEAAPLAAAIQALGPPRPAPQAAGAPPADGLPAWALALALTAFLAEWLLRRLRGAR
ncbi:MAG TPA: hypothetical protein VFZ11_02545 [Gemmatimonadaceae bacterium]